MSFMITAIRLTVLSEAYDNDNNNNRL